MAVRLQKFIADAGIASRRKAEELILQGRITVNGETAEIGCKIDENNDSVAFDGKPVKLNTKLIYIMLNKPDGCVTTSNDQFYRKTVLDCLDGIEERVFPVGRLDYETSGLLILTNDGDLTYKLTHPKHNIDKTYIAKVMGTPTDDEIKRFKNGLYIADYNTKTAPADIQIIKSYEKFCDLKITIREGRNRQVRKMCQAIGHPVRNLKRVATGKLTLGNLKKGEYRFLTDDEINYLKNL